MQKSFLKKCDLVYNYITTKNKGTKLEENQKFMQIALLEAQKAFQKEEVPIGAVVVRGQKVIAKAFNKRNKSKNATHHAEILAIEKACKKLHSWRLLDCDLYVTVLPCPMCAGAIVNARVRKVFYGADNQNKQLFEQILTQSSLNHSTVFEGGLKEKECKKLMQDFFAIKRS